MLSISWSRHAITVLAIVQFSSVQFTLFTLKDKLSLQSISLTNEILKEEKTEIIGFSESGRWIKGAVSRYLATL